MTTPRTGFAYLDLNSGDFTDWFRPNPASKPQDVYIALLGRDEDCNPIVKEVYKLIGKPDPYAFERAKFIKSKDGRNLAVKTTKEDIINSLREHYEYRLGPECFNLDELTMQIDSEELKCYMM
jgi:hypothetical protein